MNLTVVLLSIATATFMVTSYFFYRGCAILAKDNSYLRALVRSKESQILSMEFRQAVAAPPLSLNEKTQKLLKLATSNTNPNEAAAAAKQVCKRLASGRY